MKKTFLQKSALAFSLAFTLVYGAIWACGGGDWYFNWEDETNFTPESFVDDKYSAYLLSQNLFYSGDLGDGASRFDDENVSDWSAYFNEKIEMGTIRYFITDSGRVDVETIYNHIFKKSQPKTVQQWSGKIDFKDKKVKNFIEFLHHAKALETFSVSEPSWEYDEIVYKRMNDVNWLKEVEKKYESTSETFLKNRYWFQVMKGYFYSTNYQPGFAFFEKTETKQPKNTLYYRAVGYLAGMNSRMGNKAKANYLYSVVFDKCPQLEKVGMFCFSSVDEKDWKETFGYAKNNDEKVALWAMQGYYSDEELAIENIFNLNPKSDYLEFLLARLINNEELKINKTIDKWVVEEYKLEAKDSISPSAVKLVDKIAQSGKVNKPYYWNCVAGYLQTLDGNYSKADTYFSKAEKDLPQTKYAKGQLRLFRFVNNLSKIDKVDDKNIAELIPDLNWLYFELPRYESDDFIMRYRNASNWSKNYISALYKAKKNSYMAELFVHEAPFYNTYSNVVGMKKFLLKPNKSTIEQVGEKVYEFSAVNISEYQSFVAVSQNKIPEAIAYLKESDQQDVTFYGNPFNGNIKDCHDCDFEAKQKRSYTHLELLTTMQLMKDKIAKKEDVYTNANLLANAFYNLTHYGNARLFYEGNILGYYNTEFDIEFANRRLLTDCSLAKTYYQKALSAAQNDEQKAKMHFMIAKCERNEYYYKKYLLEDNWWSAYRDEVNFLAWNGFVELRKNYSKTKYYQDAIAECGYFNTYVNQNKR